MKGRIKAFFDFLAEIDQVFLFIMVWPVALAAAMFITLIRSIFE